MITLTAKDYAPEQEKAYLPAFAMKEHHSATVSKADKTAVVSIAVFLAASAVFIIADMTKHSAASLAVLFLMAAAAVKAVSACRKNEQAKCNKKGDTSYDRQ